MTYLFVECPAKPTLMGRNHTMHTITSPNSHLRQYIWGIALIFALSLGVTALLDISHLREALLHEKTHQTRQLVESAVSVLKHFAAQEKAGKLSHTQAQQAAKETLRDMRYGQNDYFWINNTESPVPRMVLHPTLPHLEDQRLEGETFNTATLVKAGSDATFTKLPAPSNLFAAALRLAEQSGAGYVQYNWYKPTQINGKLSTTLVPKLSFVQHFEPWGWIVGSGVYIDDIDEQIKNEMVHQLLRSLMILMVLLMITYLIARNVEAIENRMRDQKIRMQALIDSTNDSVLLLSQDGDILAINQFGANRFKQTPEQMQGKHFFSLIPESLAQSRKQACDEVIRSKEAIVIRDERQGIAFENTIYPVIEANGMVRSVAVYAKDVTEQQRNQATEELFRHLDTVVLKWQMNVQAVAQIFCDSALQIFGLSALWLAKGESDGRLSHLAHAEMGAQRFLMPETMPKWWHGDEACHWPPIAEAIHAGQRKLLPLDPNLPMSEHIAQAQAKHISAALVLPITVQDKTWGVLTLYAEDTERLNEQQRLFVGLTSRLANAIESAQQQEWLALLNSALTKVNNAVFMVDGEDRLVWANPSFSKLTGLAQNDLMDYPLARLFANPAQLKERIEPTVRLGKFWTGTVELCKKEGQHFPASLSLTPLKDIDGNLTHHVGIVEEIDLYET